MIPRPNEVTCFYCHRPFYAHDRVNNECFVYQRAETRPWRLGRRVQTPVTGWRVR